MGLEVSTVETIYIFAIYTYVMTPYDPVCDY
jgi:hypothetical protein